jgi:hypothetical protein
MADCCVVVMWLIVVWCIFHSKLIETRDDACLPTRHDYQSKIVRRSSLFSSFGLNLWYHLYRDKIWKEQQSAAIKDSVVIAEELLLMLADSTLRRLSSYEIDNQRFYPSVVVVLVICFWLVVLSVQGQIMYGTTECCNKRLCCQCWRLALDACRLDPSC